jgi:hypothetical protein
LGDRFSILGCGGGLSIPGRELRESFDEAVHINWLGNVGEEPFRCGAVYVLGAAESGEGYHGHVLLRR